MHREKNKIVEVIAEIEVYHVELKQQLELVHNTLTEHTGSHIVEDFKALKKAIQKSRILFDKLYRTLEAGTEKKEAQRIRHDLRSVMSAIIGFSELIIDGLERQQTSDVKIENFERMILLSQKILRLMDHLQIKEGVSKMPKNEKSRKGYVGDDHQTLKKLAEAKQLFATTIESIEEGFAIFDAEDRLVSYNQHFSDLYPAIESLGNIGFTYEEFLLENWRLGIYQEERRSKLQNIQPTSDVKERDEWIKLYLEHHRKPQHPYQVMLRSGQWIEVTETKIPSGGIVSIHKDITEDKHKEQQLKYLTHHDPLTGLINRGFFEKQLHEVFHQSEQENSKFAILFLDIDDFKMLNDTFGHDFGDYILSSTAQRFKAHMREEDLVGRVGGDEFAAIIDHVADLAQVEEIAMRCIDSIGMKIERDGQLTTLTVSLGISMYPDHGKDLKVLFKKADEAASTAKKAGKGKFTVASVG